MYVPGLVGVKFPSGIIWPFTLIVAVPLLFVINVIGIVSPISYKCNWKISIVVLVFSTVNVVCSVACV
ncbi:hypothetical protein [Methanobrevibacter sp.]